MQGEVWFYHLERRDLAEALFDLLEKCAAKGWRAIVRGREAGRLDALDEALWTLREGSFLPHGRDGEHAARQPVLLTTGAGNPNGAKVLFLVDGAALEALDGFQRVCLVFDGRDGSALTAARGAWKAVKAAGDAAIYYREKEGGGWEKRT